MMSIVYVRAFGAVADGVTDDGPAFNAAIAAVNTLGGKVVASDGTYYIATPIVMMRTGKSIHIIGESTSGTFLTSNGVDIPVLTMGGPPFSSLERMTLSGGGVGCGNPVLTITRGAQNIKDVNLVGGRNGVRINGIENPANDCWLQRVVTFGAYGPQCLVLGVVDGLECDKCSFDLSGPHSIVPTGSVSNWQPATVYVPGNMAIVGSTGFYIQCMSGGTSGSSPPALQNYGIPIVDGAVVWQLSAPTGALVQIDSGCGEAYFSHCDISGSAGFGVYVSNDNPENGPPPQLVFFDHCTFGSAINHVFLANAGGRLTIESCEIIGGDVGIYFANSWSGPASIVGCQFLNSTLSAILAAGGLGLTITGNCFPAGSAFVAAAGLTRFVVSGNTVGAGAANMTVQPGASDTYTIANNILGGGTVYDGGTGTNKTISGNH